MSGGHYEYRYRAVEHLSEEILDNGDCCAADPELRAKFKKHLALVAKALRAIEWNDSGDGDKNEESLILACLQDKTE